MDDSKKNKKQLIVELNRLRELSSRVERGNKNALSDKHIDEFEFFKAIFNNASVGIFVLDENVNYVSINPACGTIMGQNPDDWIGKRAGSSLHPDDRDKASEVFYQVLEGQSFNYEFRVKASEGEYRVLNLNLLSLNYSDKKYAMGVVTDITDRKRAEQALRENEERYRLFADNIPFILAATDESGKYVFWNKYGEKFLGYGPEEVVGRLYSADVHASLEEAQRVLATAAEKGVFDGEVTLKRKDGGLVPAHLVVVPHKSEDGKIVNFYGFAEDITKRKQAEKDLRESEERYKSLFNSVFEGIAIHENGILLDVNQSLANMLGFEPSEMIGQSAFRYFAPQEREEIEWHLGAKTVKAHENIGLKKDGSAMIGEIVAKTINYGGRPARLVAIRDISESKRAMDTIKESLELYKTLVEMSPDAITMSDLNGKVIMVNKSSLKLFGFDENTDLAGFEGFNYIASKDKQRALENLFSTLEKGSISGAEYSFIKKDGSAFIGELSASTIYDANGSPKGFITVIRDTTEKRKMEDDLLRVKKLESIGVLAGGIAHDFNNILTAILGNISLGRLYCAEDGKILKSLMEAEKSCVRARDLTQQLLTFSKGGAPIKKTASIAELLKDTAEFTVSGSNVRCEFDIAEDLYAAEVDEGQISQVISNLVINSIQATPQGGAVQISADNIAVEDSDVLPVNSGNYVRVSIKDNGAGISKEHIQKIFDPYFSTKQKGSGLGLAITYSIIKKHEGHIHAESELGKGAVFTFYLPASNEPVFPKADVVEIRTIHGEGKILLMDDEEIIRRVGGEVLEYMGYNVEFARDGSEVIEKYKKAIENGTPFDAVIMDLTIVDGMGGQETIQKLIEIDPDVKAVVSSGYSNDPVMANYREYGFKGVISKPYEIRELSKVLHMVLRE